MANQPGDSAPDGSPTPRWRILIVDDEESVRSLAKACIHHGLGPHHEPLEAAGGEEAIAIAEREHPDLVLLDIRMPGLDGFEVCRRLKSSPHTRDIPVLFLTALGRDQDVAQGLDRGGEAYVVKPFNAVTLAAQISELLAPPDEHRG